MKPLCLILLLVYYLTGESREFPLNSSQSLLFMIHLNLWVLPLVSLTKFNFADLP